LAERYWKSLTPKQSLAQQWERAADSIFAGNLEAARQIFQDAFTDHEDLNSAVEAALLADELNDTQTRDELLEKIERHAPKSAIHLELVRLFKLVLRGGESGHWNHHAFETLAADLQAGYRTSFYYFAGQFLSRHGEAELANECQQSAATSWYVSAKTCVLANYVLRQRQVNVGPSRLHELPEELAAVVVLIQRSRRAKNEKRFDEALALLNRAIEEQPDSVPAYLARASLAESQENDRDAIADYQDALRVDADCESAHRNLAWLLATSTQDDIRNGPQALEHAERALSLRETKTVAALEALAAALAECGQFDKAVEHQQRAARLAPAKSDIRDRLEVYRDGKPYRRGQQPKEPRTE
jgi:tetratricopeptide (TPR) repeat protein